MRICRNVSLASLTTLRLGGKATRLVTVESGPEAVEVVREADARGEPLFVLGGGSNVVIADQGWDGTALCMRSRGLETSNDGQRVLVTAQAGEPWGEFVDAMVAEGLAGVECLAGIPGLVGAVPMQNVGAYGQDVSETVVSVRAYDRDRHEMVEFSRDACSFGYRTSVFRGTRRHVIVAVTFSLERASPSRPIRYAELAKALGVPEGARAPLEHVRSTVVELRKKKGMLLDPDDRDTYSAGSFFTNPILSEAELASLNARVAQDDKAPIFPERDGRYKVSAAWLIERAGFAKGFTLPDGRVGLSTKHSLSLTNRGGATTADLVALARRIRDGVRERFGVTLENEPVFVGISL